jgi:hypothetical protein
MNRAALLLLLLLAACGPVVDEEQCPAPCDLDAGEICIQDEIDGPWRCVVDP